MPPKKRSSKKNETKTTLSNKNVIKIRIGDTVVKRRQKTTSNPKEKIILTQANNRPFIIQQPQSLDLTPLTTLLRQQQAQQAQPPQQQPIPVAQPIIPVAQPIIPVAQIIRPPIMATPTRQEIALPIKAEPEDIKVKQEPNPEERKIKQEPKMPSREEIFKPIAEPAPPEDEPLESILKRSLNYKRQDLLRDVRNYDRRLERLSREQMRDEEQQQEEVKPSPPIPPPKKRVGRISSTLPSGNLPQDSNITVRSKRKK